MGESKIKAFPQRCVKCGRPLDSAMRFFLFDNNYPGSCAEHLHDVLTEADRDYSMWPHDWYGHCYRDTMGFWRHIPGEGQVP